MSNEDAAERDPVVPLTTAERDPVVPRTTAAPHPATQPQRSIFSLPLPVKRVFDQFPLREYDANQLPWRAPTEKSRHRLHVFATELGARDGRPSFNPSCLKWQTYLRMSGFPFLLVSSNNHASPSGSLPFLQPGSPDRSASTPRPIPANRLRKWLAQHHGAAPPLSETEDGRVALYQSLVDDRIRKAWLYQLYLAPQNDDLMQSLYVRSCSNHLLVRFALTRHLRAAAETEMIQSVGTHVVDADVLLHEAGEALATLSMQLGEQQWFFGENIPGVFDASVFAFTHLLLDEELGWKYNPLGDALSKHANLVRHRTTILQSFYTRDDPDGAARSEMRERNPSTLGTRDIRKG